MSNDVVSPCTNVCIMEKSYGYCRGCHRTLNEIAGWASYTNDEKRALLQVLDSRRSTLSKLKSPP